MGWPARHLIVENAELRWARVGARQACADILATIPEWFGIPEANADYAATADREPTIVAELEGQPIGVLTLVMHSSSAAEVHLLAVRAGLHDRGLGSRMLEMAEQRLADEGVLFLQVKTLAATSPDVHYEKTRAFYRANGFVDLEVFPTLWDPANPALQMIKMIEGVAPPTD